MSTRQIAQPRSSAAAPPQRVRPRAGEMGEKIVAAPAPGAPSLSGDIVGARVSRLEWSLYSAFFFIGLIMRL